MKRKVVRKAVPAKIRLAHASAEDQAAHKRCLAKLKQLEPRELNVRRTKEAIELGDYENDLKLSVALDRMLGLGQRRAA
jgi:hypothetical protein